MKEFIINGVNKGILICILCVPVSLKSQKRVGVSAEYMNYVQSNVYSDVIGVEYPGDMNDGMRFYEFKASHFIAIPQKRQVTLVPKYSNTPDMEANYKLNTGIINVSIGIERYIVGDHDSGGYFLAMGFMNRMGRMFVSEHDEVDENKYSKPFPSSATRKTVGGFLFVFNQGYTFEIYKSFYIIPQVEGAIDLTAANVTGDHVIPVITHAVVAGATFQFD